MKPGDRPARKPAPSIPNGTQGAAWGLGAVLGVAAVLAVTGLVAYGNTFGVPFVFDDSTWIAGNPHIRQLWHPMEVFRTRPVLGFTLALNWAWTQNHVSSYHFLNLAIHVLAALTLFGLVRRTLAGEVLRPRWGKHSTKLALAVALVWLVHPLNTMAVTYIIQRGEALMGLFYFLALYCVVRGHGSRYGLLWWVGAFLACLLALGSKQVAATLPVVILLYYWVFLPETFRWRSGRRWWWYTELGSLLLMFVLCVVAGLWMLRESSSPMTGFGVAGVTPWTYALTQGEVLMQYLRLSVWPAGLVLDYGWPLASPGEVLPWVAAGVVAALLAVVAWGVIRRRPWGFLGAWVFVVLAPTSSFMPIVDVAMEYRMYLPLAGLVALAVFAAWALGERLLRGAGAEGQERRMLLGAAGAVLLVGVLAALTYATLSRNGDYRTELALWEDTAVKRPENYRALSNYGAKLAAAGRHDEAALPLRKALALKRDYADGQNNLAVWLSDEGKQWKALAGANQRQGRLREAQEYSRRADESFRESLTYFEALLQQKPQFATAYLNRAVVYEDIGRNADALADCTQALSYMPDYADAFYHRGNAYLNLKQYDAAIADYTRAVELKPDYGDAYHNRAAACFYKGLYAQAWEDVDRCVAHGSEPEKDLLDELSKKAPRPR